jgi:hypothetical protein
MRGNLIKCSSPFGPTEFARDQIQMSSLRKNKLALKSKAGELIKKLRKPMAPPTRVVADESIYNRARERELTRRISKK